MHVSMNTRQSEQDTNLNQSNDDFEILYFVLQDQIDLDSKKVGFFYSSDHRSQVTMTANMNSNRKIQDISQSTLKLSAPGAILKY